MHRRIYHGSNIRTLLITFVASLLFSLQTAAQSYYEIKWSGDGIDYTAFLVYYDLNDVTVRVKYRTKDGTSKIAEFKCTGEYKNENGKRNFLYDGRDARIVYTSNPSNNYGYNADNFIFLNVNSNNNYESLYTIDDWQLTQKDADNYYKKAEYRQLDPLKDFSFTYLKGFFQTNEELYKKLVSNYLESRSTGSNVTNYRISDMQFGGDKWAVVMSKGTPYKEQSWKTSVDFPSDWIKEKWDDAYAITSVVYGKSDWALVMSQGTSLGPQTWKTSASYPSDWINEKWNLGYHITSMAYGQGLWGVVMSKNSGYQYQSWKTSETFPGDWIQEKWKDGYRVTVMTYGGGKWAIVMAKGSNTREQRMKWSSTGYPEEWIKKNWSDDYDVTQSAYGPDGWAMVMTKGFSLQQTYTQTESYPSSWIRDRWAGTTTVSNNVSQNGNNNNPTNNNNNKTVRIHLITVADTYDPSIGKSCENDRSNVANLMRKITDEIGVELKLTQVDGSSVTKSGILSAVNGLSVGSNDVVVFYYSGHGYNELPKSSDFPAMSLSGPDLKLEETYNLIRGRNPRLSIVIGDLCNSVPRARDGTGNAGEIAFRSGANFDAKKLSRLFLTARGGLISTSSDYNEWSFSLPDGRGEGAFTKSFIASFLKDVSVVSDSPGDWQNILRSAYTAALYHTSHIRNQNGKFGQNGFFRGNISYTD